MKDAAAVELGRKGGKASAKRLTNNERREKARKAAEVKWARRNMEPGLYDLTSAGVHRTAIGLTRREREVAEYAAEGRSNKYIAQRLRIGVNTVKKHISQALEKLGAGNRTELSFRLKDRRGDSGKRGLKSDFIGGVLLEAAKEAYEMAEYLVTRSQPISESQRNGPD
ncbi:MAG: helix-turn-helix transcriptional regulator [Acidobacteria bacterium]|nr:helix-turn-helix transcriptional regulator [Acidobacteriota bacterium]